MSLDLTLTLKALPISREAGFPQVFDTIIKGQLFRVEVDYNPEDFFTLTLYSPTGEIICEGKKIVYGADVLNGVVHHALPSEGLKLIAIDPSGELGEVTKHTLDLGVKVYAI